MRRPPFCRLLLCAHPVIDQPQICQSALGTAPWRDPLTSRLPGLQPVLPGDWLIRDEAFGEQMRLRDHLLTEHPTQVLAHTPGSHGAQLELFSLIIRELRASGAYQDEGRHIVRPDGVAIDPAQPPPLMAAARLVQEDLAILADGESGHVLVAAAIAFPASWSLAEKMGRSLASIHQPVGRIAADMDDRIEALLQRLPADRIVQRSNALAYNDPGLHQPRREHEPRAFDPDNRAFIRVERQTLRRLPDSGAIAFTIHTTIVRFSALSSLDQEQACAYLETIGAVSPRR